MRPGATNTAAFMVFFIEFSLHDGEAAPCGLTLPSISIAPSWCQDHENADLPEKTTSFFASIRLALP
jgi:hypothetical protein